MQILRSEFELILDINCKIYRLRQITDALESSKPFTSAPRILNMPNSLLSLLVLTKNASKSSCKVRFNILLMAAHRVEMR